jgi:5-(aminomethyl)-3-furanmethanol phosphate kinase
MRGGAPIVVKVGGSLAFSKHLRPWVEALAGCAGRVVIVPGGGPFADAVRLAQTRMGFHDQTAHHLAVLAMEQYGRALASLASILSPADSADAIRDGLTAGRVPVWMPSLMVLRAGDITQSWSVTSDSLAAWLAGRIGANQLLLIKHAKNLSGRADGKDLIAAGMLDEAFAIYLKRSAAAAYVVGPSDHATAGAAIRAGATAGIPVQWCAESQQG